VQRVNSCANREQPVPDLLPSGHSPVGLALHAFSMPGLGDCCYRGRS
jgi:hypothetical protein